MSRRLDHLVPDVEYRAQLIKTDFEVRHPGYELLIYCTWRSPQDQARLFRQSRGLVQIQAKAQVLEDDGFPELAEILVGVGPVHGKLGAHVTKAGPGESWHQYGLALDAVPVFSGKTIWDDDHEAWWWYHELARRNGLVPLSWEKPHVQRRPAHENPLRALSRDVVRENIKGPTAWRTAA